MTIREETVAAASTSAFQAGGIEVDDGRLRWVDLRFPVLFIFLGCVSAFAIATSPAERSPLIGIALVTMAVSPWLLTLVQVHLPDAAFIGTVLAPIAFLLVFGESWGLVDFSGGAPQLVLMLIIGLVGQVATVADVRTIAATTIAGMGVVLAGAIVRGDPLDFMPWWIGILLGAGGGMSFRTSVLRLARLQEAQQALAEQTISDERRRIAREVHDIVSHTMSVTMLHLTAARLALRTDPDAAEDALVEAEKHGRASMEDIRRVVRLLRNDESSLAAALPDDADIEDLVAQMRAAGSDVRLLRHDDLDEASPGIRLAVYRVVQESLSNATRHGDGPVTVAVTSSNTHIEIDVENSFVGTRPPGDGTGLDGMRERVLALDGTLRCEPAGPGRWVVHAEIPS